MATTVVNTTEDELLNIFRTSKSERSGEVEVFDFGRHCRPAADMVNPLFAFYLKPLLIDEKTGNIAGAFAADAVVYMEAARSHERNANTDAGWEPINRVQGEGRGVHIDVPSLDRCKEICEELERRKIVARAFLQFKIEECEEQLRGEELPNARIVTRKRRQAYRKLLDQLDCVYDPASLRDLCIDVRAYQLQNSIPTNMRRILNALDEENQWKRERNRA